MSDFRLPDFLPFRINRIAEALGREVMPIYRDMLGIGRPEWRALAHLGASGACSATHLGEVAAMDKVKVSRAIATLEARGWVTRQRDTDDGRVSLISLTEAGRAAYARVTPAMQAGLSRSLSQMSAHQQAKLNQVLTDLEKALGIDS